jgi:hypothetical protein
VGQGSRAGQQGRQHSRCGVCQQVKPGEVGGGGDGLLYARRPHQALQLVPQDCALDQVLLRRDRGRNRANAPLKQVPTCPFLTPKTGLGRRNKASGGVFDAGGLP